MGGQEQQCNALSNKQMKTHTLNMDATYTSGPTYTHENGITYDVVPAIDLCFGCAFTDPQRFCTKGKGKLESFKCVKVIAIHTNEHDKYIANKVVYRLKQAHG